MSSLTTTYSEFCQNNSIVSALDRSYEFAYSVTFAEVPFLQMENVKSAIASILVAKITERLDEAELYAGDNVEVAYTDTTVHVNYGDDVYGFSVALSKDRYVFFRRGGTIKELFDLFDIVFDTIVDTFDLVRGYLEGVGSNLGIRSVCTPHFCEYSFKFLVANFCPSQRTAKNSFRNYELMERIVPSVQRRESPLHSLDFLQRGRTDLKLSGSLELDEVRWLAWVNIDAPGNRSYSSMYLTFELQSTRHDTERGTRTPFDPRSLRKWKSACIDYLRDRVFSGFLQNWLNDVNFSCQDRL